MHLAAARWACVGVHPVGQQWMAVPDAVADDLDDALALGLFEELRWCARRCRRWPARRSPQSDRRHTRRQAGGRGHRRGDLRPASAPDRSACEAVPFAHLVTGHQVHAPTQGRRRGYPRTPRQSAPWSGEGTTGQGAQRTTREGHQDSVDGPGSARSHPGCPVVATTSRSRRRNPIARSSRGPARPLSLLATKATTALLDGSSHCRSSMPMTTGVCFARVSTTESTAAATTCWSVGGRPATSRKSTRSIAIRCTSGSAASASAGTSPTMSATVP